MNEIRFFEKEILEWFELHGRNHLPWRKKNITAYEVWVSEIMLQQTQVSRVIDYYNRFVEKFPTVFDLSKASWEEFYAYYAGLGYYNRGRNMLQCSKVIVERHKGFFPTNKQDLIDLPGIGEYTASAILSFAYNKNELAKDTNIKKVFGRYFSGGKSETVDFESLENKLLENKRQLNAAVMDFASSICIKVPRCGECPLQKYCKYYQTDGKKELIQKKTKEVFPTRDASVVLTLHKDHKEYYSLSKKQYKPFVLSSKYNTRETIKEYFQSKYGLTLAVRPPHKKYYEDGKSVMQVNAQILLGNNKFFVYNHSKQKPPNKTP